MSRPVLSKWIKHFQNTLIQKIYFLIFKSRSFLGELSGVSAKTQKKNWSQRHRCVVLSCTSNSFATNNQSHPLDRSQTDMLRGAKAKPTGSSEFIFKTKLFFGYFHPINLFSDKKKNKIPGDLSDVSAKTARRSDVPEQWVYRITCNYSNAFQYSESCWVAIRYPMPDPKEGLQSPCSC